ncbi:MAG: hypothetical protein ACYC6P_09690 [Ignavibacteriaceae bacterium]
MQPVNSGNYSGNLLLTKYFGTDTSTTTKFPIYFSFADSGLFTYNNYNPSGAGTFQNTDDSVILTDKVVHLQIFHIHACHIARYVYIFVQISSRRFIL